MQEDPLDVGEFRKPVEAEQLCARASDEKARPEPEKDFAELVQDGLSVASCPLKADAALDQDFDDLALGESRTLHELDHEAAQHVDTLTQVVAFLQRGEKLREFEAVGRILLVVRIRGVHFVVIRDERRRRDRFALFGFELDRIGREGLFFRDRHGFRLGLGLHFESGLGLLHLLRQREFGREGLVLECALGRRLDDFTSEILLTTEFREVGIEAGLNFLEEVDKRVVLFRDDLRLGLLGVEDVLEGVLDLVDPVLVDLLAPASAPRSKKSVISSRSRRSA